MNKYKVIYQAYSKPRTSIVQDSGYPCSTFSEEAKAKNKEEAEDKFKDKYEVVRGITIINIEEIQT